MATKTLTIRLSEETLSDLQQLAEEKGAPRATLLRSFIETGVKIERSYGISDYEPVPLSRDSVVLVEFCAQLLGKSPSEILEFVVQSVLAPAAKNTQARKAIDDALKGMELGDHNQPLLHASTT